MGTVFLKKQTIIGDIKMTLLMGTVFCKTFLLLVGIKETLFHLPIANKQIVCADATETVATSLDSNVSKKYG